MLIFINNVFVSNDNIEYIELVIHDEKTLTNSFKVCTYEDCKKFCIEKKAEGWAVYPLVGDSLELNNKICRVTKIDAKSNIVPSYTKEDSLLSIYSLYWDLAQNSGVYLDDEYKYEEGYIGYLSEFLNLSIHKDSMKITIPVLYKDKNVAVRELISQNVTPYHNSFKAAIPKENIDKFYMYGVKASGSITLNNKEFIIIEYNQNLSIYRSLADFKFSEPLAVYYGNMSRRYEILIELVKCSLNSLDVTIDETFDAFMSESFSSSSLFNNFPGVYINHTVSFPKKEEIKRAYELISVIYESYKEGKVDYVNTTEGIRSLVTHYGLSRLLEIPMTVLFNAYIKSNGSEVSLMDGLLSIYNNSRLKVLESDMYLYNLRTSCLINPSSLDYTEGQMMFYIKGPGEPMRMEVWD